MFIIGKKALKEKRPIKAFSFIGPLFAGYFIASSEDLY
jgi:hypothetical protein